MKTTSTKFGINHFSCAALIALIIFFLSQNRASAANTIDPAQNPLTPVRSISDTETDSGQSEPSDNQSVIIKTERGPLLPPSPIDSTPDESLLNLTIRLSAEVAKLDLTKEERDQFESASNALITAVENSDHASTITADTKPQNLQAALSNLEKFVEQHSDKKNIVDAAGLVFDYVFKKLEEKTLPFEDTLQSQATQKLFESVLKPDSETPALSEKAPAYSPARSIKDTGAAADPVQKNDETMNLVLEILRQRAVNENTPALHRAIYKSWYLSLATKTRMIRLNRVRMMLAKQTLAEEFKVATAYN